MYTERRSKTVNVKMTFWRETSGFSWILRRTITPEGVAPQMDKVRNFRTNFKFPKSKNASEGILAF